MNAEKSGPQAQSSCYACAGTPCCRYLPVKRFKVRTRADVEDLIFLLSRDRVEAGLYDTGDWVLYYQSRCRFLEDAGTCGIHEEPQRPQICADYGSGRCWYRFVFNGGADLSFIRFNWERLCSVLPLITYLPSGEIDREPGWEEILSRLKDIPLSRSLSPPGCREYPGRTDDLLFVELPQPGKVRDLDFFKFRLGFLGTSLVIGKNSWGIGLHAPQRTEIVFPAEYSPKREPALKEEESSIVTDLDGLIRISARFIPSPEGTFLAAPDFAAIRSVLSSSSRDFPL